jgi:CitMHS family citrate-Mg2+:H+ or citrate-Ca2+:H+ symporter
MVATFMFLIMTKRTTPVVGLILVPIAFGLFDPIVRGVVRAVKADPARLVVGTALLAMVVSLDGDGSTTFIIVTSALLPLYLKLGVSPVVLTVTAGLANGTLNILPWGGPTARAAAALGISPSEVFIPMIPSLVVGLVIVLLFSYHLGLMERRRIGSITIKESVLARESADVLVGSGGGNGRGRGPRRGAGGWGTGGSGTDAIGAGSGEDARNTDSGDTADAGIVAGALDPDRVTLRPKLFWINLALTVVLLAVLGMDVAAIPVLFMVAAGIALVINFPHIKDQQQAITRHSSSIVSVVAMVLAAAVLTGVFAGTGMVEAIAQWLTSCSLIRWGRTWPSSPASCRCRSRS